MGALQEEIAALKDGGASNRYGLRDGLLVGRVGGRFLYVFLADSELSIPADSPGLLVLGPDASCEAAVVAVQGFEVTLAVPRDLGERIPTATLLAAPYYLLEILARRLTEAGDGRLPANRHLALALFAREPTAMLPQPEVPLTPPVPASPGGLTADGHASDGR